MTTFKENYDEAMQKIKDGDYSPAKFDIGDIVICDLCNTDYTDSVEVGGILFGSISVGDCLVFSKNVEVSANESRFSI